MESKLTMAGVLLFIFFSLFFAVYAERTRRNPYKGQNLFMTKQGWTRSIFALPYLGRPEEARKALVEDKNLRRKFIIELYVWAAVALLAALAQLFG